MNYKNTKIIVNSKVEFRKAEKFLFSKGLVWNGNTVPEAISTVPSYSRYICVNEHNRMLHGRDIGNRYRTISMSSKVKDIKDGILK